MTLESLPLEQFGLEGMEGILAGGALSFLLGAALILVIILFAAFYVYFALAWQTIAKKLKYKNPWLAWIPFANISMMLQLGGFHWAWVFLFLVPVLGWIAIFVLIIIANWKTFEARGHEGWLSLSQIIPKVGGILYLIAIGFVAWQDKPKAKKPKKKKSSKKKR